VSFHSFNDEIPPDAVKELGDIQINHPVLLPTTFPAALYRVQCALPRPITVGILVEDWFHANP
jgi:hypothetical protein